MAVRFKKQMVLGREVLVRETMDPEINGRVENAAIVGLTPEEIDAMRCEANGTQHMPIKRAEELRKARPKKRRKRTRDAGQVLVDLVKASLKNEGQDIMDDDRIADGLVESNDLDSLESDRDDAVAAENVELYGKGEPPPPPAWQDEPQGDEHEFDDLS